MKYVPTYVMWRTSRFRESLTMSWIYSFYGVALARLNLRTRAEGLPLRESKRCMVGHSCALHIEEYVLSDPLGPPHRPHSSLQDKVTSLLSSINRLLFGITSHPLFSSRLTPSNPIQPLEHDSSTMLYQVQGWPGVDIECYLSWHVCRPLQRPSVQSAHHKVRNGVCVREIQATWEHFCSRLKLLEPVCSIVAPLIFL